MLVYTRLIYCGVSLPGLPAVLSFFTADCPGPAAVCPPADDAVPAVHLLAVIAAVLLSDVVLSVAIVAAVISPAVIDAVPSLGDVAAVLLLAVNVAVPSLGDVAAVLLLAV